MQPQWSHNHTFYQTWKVYRLVPNKLPKRHNELRAVARLLRLRVRTPPGTKMSVSCECWVCQGRSLRRADHSSRGLLQRVVCLNVIWLLFSRLYNVSTSSSPVWQLHYLLPSVASVIPVVFHQSLFPHQSSNPVRPVRLGLPRFLLPGGRHFITSFGNLPSSILETCPYHCSCFVLVSSKTDLVTFIFCLMIVFLILFWSDATVTSSKPIISR